MCTSVILFRKEHSWPLIIGSNRDESLSRKSKFPARHWEKNYPQIIGGLDLKEMGSWIAVNDHGLISIIHNRKLEKNNTLKKKSRGHIILELLNFEKIESAVESLQNINQTKYNGFNIFLGNKSCCYWGKHISVDKKVEIKEINEGLSILTDKDLNDVMDKKTNFYLNKFSQATSPEPDKGNWLAWEHLLAKNKIENQQNPEESICFIDKNKNYGTRSSSMIAISKSYSIQQFKNRIIFLSTKHSPVKSNFVNVEIEC